MALEEIVEWSWIQKNVYRGLSVKHEHWAVELGEIWWRFVWIEGRCSRREVQLSVYRMNKKAIVIVYAEVLSIVLRINQDLKYDRGTRNVLRIS